MKYPGYSKEEEEKVKTDLQKAEKRSRDKMLEKLKKKSKKKK